MTHIRLLFIALVWLATYFFSCAPMLGKAFRINPDDSLEPVSSLPYEMTRFLLFIQDHSTYLFPPAQLASDQVCWSLPPPPCSAAVPTATAPPPTLGTRSETLPSSGTLSTREVCTCNSNHILTWQPHPHTGLQIENNSCWDMGWKWPKQQLLAQIQEFYCKSTKNSIPKHSCHETR